MPANGPLYFADFESLFNRCGSESRVKCAWASYAVQLEKGLTLYEQHSGAVVPQELGDLKLVGSPTDYNAAKGDHGDAVASVSKELNLHEAQSLLLLKRWVRSTNTQVSPGWVPSDAQCAALRRSYASQRWHHLLCMRHVAELSAAKPAAGDDVANEGVLHVADAMPVSTASMFSGLLRAVGNAIDDKTADQLIINDQPLHDDCVTPNRNPRYRTRDSSDQAVCELCLMLQTMLCLLSYVKVDLGSVLESVKQIHSGVAQSGLSAWHDRASVHGLVPRYAVACILHLLQCRCEYKRVLCVMGPSSCRSVFLNMALEHRGTEDVMESPQKLQGCSHGDVDSLVLVGRYYLEGRALEALSPCMLTCAAQILATERCTPEDTELCRNLVLTAEAHKPIAAVRTLLGHQMLKAECPGVFADSIFYAVGTWCHLFSLRTCTMEKEVLYQFLSMMSELMQSSSGLAMCVRLI